jgi:hypothetical protein
MPAAEAELLAGRRVPHPGDDRELLLEHAEPLHGGRERHAVGGVLGVEPAGAEAELHPAAAHLVHLGHAHRQRPWPPERHRAHQRAEPDPGGLQGQPGQRDPRVGRAGQPAALTHVQVVVGPEERVESQLLGGLGQPPQRGVVGALLWLGEYP